MLKRRLMFGLCMLFLLTGLLVTFSIANPAQAAEVKVLVDGKALSMDVKPVIENGRTLVPLRAIFEALDAKVDWDGKTRTVTAVKGSTNIKLVIDSNTAFKNGQKVKLDVPAKIRNGRTLVPVRFVSESLGAKVDWNAATYTVTITGKVQFVTITDSKGKQVKVPCSPERIVAIGGSYGPETLLAFGVRDKIVGVTDYAKKREDLKLFLNNVPDVGGSSKPSIEKILELKPDLVLAYAIYSYPELEKVLNKMGIPLVQMDFYKVENYDREVRALGKVLNKEKRAEELIGFEKRYLDLITKRVKDIKPEKRIRVYLESYKDYQTVSQGNENHNAIIACGGINIFPDEPTKTPVISPEAVVTKNPDIIIKLVSGNSCPSGYGVIEQGPISNLRNEIINRPGWEHLNAVKNGKVYIISTDAKSIHSSVFHSYLAKWFYHDRFKDLDPETVHREWMQKFLGIELKGIYAFPLF